MKFLKYDPFGAVMGAFALYDSGYRPSQGRDLIAHMVTEGTPFGMIFPIYRELIRITWNLTKGWL